MKILSLVLLCLVMVGCNKRMNLESEQQKLSYALGQSLAWQIKQRGLSVDPELVADSIRRGLKGETPEIAYIQMREILAATNPQVMNPPGVAAASAKPPVVPAAKPDKKARASTKQK